jgi:hypothetical protein
VDVVDVVVAEVENSEAEVGGVAVVAEETELVGTDGVEGSKTVESVT